MKKNYNTNNKQKNIKIDNERVYTDNKKEKNYDDQIEGRNSVLELLESGKNIYNKRRKTWLYKQNNCNSKRKKNYTSRKR